MSVSRSAALLTTTVALCVGAHAALANPLEFTNGSGGTATIYGQLSPTYLGVDDGEETFDETADNAISNSRAGLKLAQPLGGGNTIGFRFETALGAPQSSAFSQDVDPIWDWERTDIRHVDVYVSGSWGKFSLGQGSMATDGVAEIDLSKTVIGNYSQISDTAGGFFFRENGGDLSDVTIKDAFSNFDGSRRGRVRYDTPSFNDVTLSAAYGTDILSNFKDKTYYDVAATYAPVFDALDLQAGLGYAWVDADDDVTGMWLGSVSAVHKATGLNGTLAAGSEQDGGNYWYLKGGWIAQFFPIGTTAFGASYYDGSDFVEDGSDSEYWGVQLVQAFEDVNAEAYVSYGQAGFSDDSDVRFQDIDATLVGLRWKF